MITKVLQSNDLRATLDYIYQDGKEPEVVAGSCLSTSKEGAYTDIKEMIDQRTEISKPVFHAVLSVPEHEDMIGNKWEDIAEEYVKKMGYGEVPYVAVRHQDTAHQHIHIVASRIDRSGELISDSFEAYRSQEVARSLEKTHALTRVPSSWDVDRRHARPEELHRGMRLNEPAQRERMHQAITESLKSTRSVAHFVKGLEAHQIRVVPNVTQDESRVQGISFERDGVRLAGSKIDRQFSWNRLQVQLDYSHKRDLDTLRRTPESPSHTSGRDAIHSPRHTQESPHPARLNTLAPVATQELSSSVSRHPVTPHNVTSTSHVVPSHMPPPESHGVARDDTQRIAMALRRAPEDQGWRAWSDSLKRDGVEAVPKVTQKDHSTIKGMYFVSGDAMLPGSKVSHEYSFGHLEQRLGAYDTTRDAKTFERVMVPGQGVMEPREEPSKAPHAHTLSPHTSTLDETMHVYREKGWRVELEPDAFKGTWHKEVQDRQGSSYGVITQHPTHTDGATPPDRVAFVKCEHPTHYLQADMKEGVLTPHSRFASPAEISPGQQVVWKHEDGQRALIKVNAPVPTLQPDKSRSDERALVTRFERGGYRVELNPSSFKGEWVSEVRSDQGARYGVMTPDAPDQGTRPSTHVVLVKLDSDTRLIDAKLERGQVQAHGQLKNTNALHKGDAVLWRHSDRQSALIRLQPKTLAPPQPKEAHSPGHTPSSQTTTSKETVVMTQSAWLAKAHEQGHDARVLQPSDRVTGQLLKEDVTLKEGRFHVLHTREGRLRLIPHDEKLDAFKGERVMVRMRHDQSLDIKALARSKDRGIEM